MGKGYPSAKARFDGTLLTAFVTQDALETPIPRHSTIFLRCVAITHATSPAVCIAHRCHASPRPVHLSVHSKSQTN